MSVSAYKPPTHYLLPRTLHNTLCAVLLPIRCPSTPFIICRPITLMLIHFRPSLLAPPCPKAHKYPSSPPLVSFPLKESPTKHLYASGLSLRYNLRDGPFGASLRRSPDGNCSGAFCRVVISGLCGVSPIFKVCVLPYFLLRASILSYATPFYSSLLYIIVFLLY